MSIDELVKIDFDEKQKRLAELQQRIQKDLNIRTQEIKINNYIYTVQIKNNKVTISGKTLKLYENNKGKYFNFEGERVYVK
jgi:hypothetical protein